MTTILLVIQVFIVLVMAFVILLQKTGTDSLAGLSGGGMSFLSNKSSNNVFYKITVFLAIAFMLNSLLIAKISMVNIKSKSSIIEQIDGESMPKEVEPTVPEVPAATE